MKSTPVGSSYKNPSRWSRLLVVVGAVSLGLSAFAQTPNAVSTLVGTVGTPGFSNTAPGTFRFTNPSGIAVDAAGNLFVADAVNNVIRRVATNGTITNFAGSDIGAAGNADGTGNTARFSSPQGVTIDGANNLYVADTGNHAVRMITSGGVVTTIAGTAGPGITVAGGYVNASGTTARFNSPLGIAADRAGAGGAAVNLFVADSQNNAIRQVVVTGGATTTLAGSTTGVSGNTNNSNNVGTDARFSGPAGVASNAAGTTLYVADRFNNLVRQILVTGGTNVNVSTLAGSGTAAYAEGAGSLASFNGPTGIALNPAASTIFVADTLNHVIRSITTGGNTSLMAGVVPPSNSGSTDGLSTVAKFNIPSGIVADGTSVYVIDTNNQTVRKISAATAPGISSPPSSAAVLAGNNATFSVTASGNPPVTYQWQRSTDSGGTWSDLANGVGGVTGATTSQLTIASVTTAQTNHQFRVVVSNGVAPNATSTAAVLTVTQAPAITSANSATFLVNQAGSFTITTTGVPVATITRGSGFPSWAQFNQTSGQSTATISGTPTDSVGSPFTFVITANNGVGTAATQTFTLTVATTTPPALVGPTSQQVTSGATTASFSVTATGTPSTFTYQWERQASGSGSFTALTNGTVDGATFSGVTSPVLSISGITPNMNGDLYRVVVSNGATTTSSSATLSVAPIVSSPATITFVTGQSNSFNFTATGNPAPTISITHSGLPAGLSFNSPTLSGTPTDTFSSTTFITVTATNSGGSGSQSFTLNLSAPQAPVITSASSTTFSVGQPGSFTITATGAPTPTLQIFGSLPSNVSFNSATGVISGTPTDTNGSPFSITVQAVNSVSTTSQTLTLTVAGVAPTITTHPSSATGSIGQSVTFTGAAGGTPAPSIRWQRQPSGTSGFTNLADDGTYSGTGTNTLTVTGVTAGMSLDQFRFVASNGTTPDATSNAAQLNINLGTVISTIAGQVGFIGGADGSGVVARFNSPTGLAVDTAGNVYIADTANHIIRRMNSSGAVVTLAGMAGFTGTADGTGSEARFNSPQGVAVDGAGNVYVADTFNHTIRVISPTGAVSTIAGTAGSSGAVDANGASARFFGPTALAVDSSGTLYVSDSSNHAIRRVSSSRDVTTFAGSLGVAGFSDGSGINARFASPGGIALDNTGNLYVADSLNQVIRRINSGGTVTTVAGLAGNPGIVDGIGVIARFNRPIGLALDNSGNVFIADTFSSTIRKFVISTSEVTTIAGLAVSTGSTDGAGSAARFNQPVGIVIDSGGTLYVSDTRNHTIRRSGSPIAPQIQTHPTSKIVAVGQSVSFTATATGAPTPGFQWQRAAADSSGNFQNLFNDGVYGGTTTGTLAISAVTSAMNGDQFRVIANNGVQPVATSTAATLTVGTAPVFTNAATATFQAGKSNSFTVVTTSSLTVSYSATGLPSGISIDSSTGVISGTPANTTGSPFTVTVTANNGIAATQTLTLFVTPAELAPTIATQPVSITVDRGLTATFSVAVTGTAPFSYQWRRNGSAINGATGSSYTQTNIQTSAAGTYSVTVSNVVGSVTSSGATLAVNTSPVFVSQPHAEVALAGTSVTFGVTASGSSSFNYQWRKNGVPIPGATGATLTLFSVSAADAGNYDVQVSNSLGLVGSSLAQLTIVTAPVAPVITAQPVARTATVGSSVTLSVAANGAPAPSYQWRKNGAPINGANGSTLTLNNVQSGDAANYDVVINNSVGNVVSLPAGLRVIARSYAGVYFGSFGSSLGDFALFVRDDNTGVFLGYLPGSVAPVVSLNITVNDAGQFSFGQGAVASASAIVNSDEPARAAALSAVNVAGTIGTDGSLSGAVQGGASTTLSGTRAPDLGGTQSFIGFYQAGGTSNGATVYTIAGPNNVAFAIAQSGTVSDGGRGSINAAGQVSVTTSRSTILETIAPTGTVSGTSSGAITATLNGGNESLLALQRLVNISSRARVGSGDSVAIAGFVISGEESKTVLIRAVGPTLATAPFNLSGALTTPRLELFRGQTSLAVNTGIGANRAAIDAAGSQAGAFPLGSSGADAAILTTLAPGNYTAILSSTSAALGVALIEVYDLSAAAPGQKLLNIATRAAAGTGDNLLIAGFVVPPGTSKRVIVRAVGPGLAPFGITGVVPQPTLILFNGAQATVAQNTGYTTSPDRDAITSASVSVGAFGLANADSALIATLAPGNYTAQVIGTGIALIEVYELP